MKKQIILQILLSFLSLVVVAQKNYVVDGEISGLTGNWKVLLRYWGGDKKQNNDTADVINGAFKFTGTLNVDPHRVYIQLIPPGHPRGNNYKEFTYFMLENSKIKIRGSSLKEAIIVGGPIQNEYLKLGLNSTYIYSDSVALEYLKNVGSKKPNAQLQQLHESLLDSLRKKRRSAEDLFIRANNNSYLTLNLLLWRSRKAEPTDPIFRKLNDRLKKTITWKNISINLSNSSKLSIGSLAPTFVQADTAGKSVDLASFRGRYVLVEFWASWCTPCRAENPNLIKVYNEFKEKNFEILAVSIDDKKSMWVQAIKQDQLPWLHVSDLKKQGYNEAANAFHVSGVPNNFLIDPNGIIVGKDLRGENLAIKLKEILK